jgi:hypothetical protein
MPPGPGAMTTLVSTTGTLRGTFEGLAEGARLPLVYPPGCGGPPVELTISYAPSGVTATRIAPSTTTLTRSPNPPSGSFVANEPVTLTATVGQPLGAPSGTVDFTVVSSQPGGSTSCPPAEPCGSPIPGCAALPVTLAGDRYQATCETAFVAGQHSLHASFRSSDPRVDHSTSVAGGDAATGTILFVSKAMPVITVTASPERYAVGDVVTFTARITAKQPGPAVPSVGTISFGSYHPMAADASTIVRPYPECASRPTTADATGLVASCTRTIGSVQQLEIGAVWDVPVRDPNFHWLYGAYNPYMFGPPPGFGPPPPALLGDVAPSLAGVLTPTGAGARIRTLLQKGGFTFAFTPPVPGRLEVRWYLVPRGARLAAKKKPKPKPVLVASGAASFARPGPGQVTVKLTKRGKQLLRRSKGMKLTAQASFRPASSAVPAKTTRKAFTLRR